MQKRAMWAWRARGSALAALLSTLVVGSASAGVLDSFAGYTRPGTPVDGKKGVKPAVQVKGPESIGVTVYFQVYDRAGTDARDPWSTGIGNLSDRFTPGKNSPKRLDTNAEYLYLYQICNDSGRPGLLRLASIRPAVPPKLITTWGFFELKKKVEPTQREPEAYSFAVESDGATAGRSRIRPVALEPDHSGKGDDGRYSNQSPYTLARKPYDLVPMPLLTGIMPAAAKSPPGLREPEDVVIRGPAATPDEWDDYPVSVRCLFLDRPLRPSESCTVFGFTSNCPPEYREVRIVGRPPAEGGAGGADPKSLLATGTPPVPHVPEAGGVAGGYGFQPWAGGLTSGALPFGGGPGGFGGFGPGFFPFPATTNGAPNSGGGSGGATPATKTQTTTPSTPSNNGPQPTPVPEPNSLLLGGALAMGALLFWWLRHRAPASA